jgi:hypothetical protein
MNAPVTKEIYWVRFGMGPFSLRVWTEDDTLWYMLLFRNKQMTTGQASSPAQKILEIDSRELILRCIVEKCIENLLVMAEDPNPLISEPVQTAAGYERLKYLRMNAGLLPGYTPEIQNFIYQDITDIDIESFWPDAVAEHGLPNRFVELGHPFDANHVTLPTQVQHEDTWYFLYPKSLTCEDGKTVSLARQMGRPDLSLIIGTDPAGEPS